MSQTQRSSARPFTSRPGDPAWEVALLFPNQGDWTEEEYLGLDSKRQVEFRDGCLEVLPSPTFLHQWIAQHLYNLLKAHLDSRKVPGFPMLAPLPVRLGPRHYREPDVLFVRRERLTDVRSYPKGADLIMEIVSDDPEGRERDLVIKRDIYAKAGIPEYWIVDPKEKSITVLTLKGAEYSLHGEFADGQEATSVELPGLCVSVDNVFAEPPLTGETN